MKIAKKYINKKLKNTFFGKCHGAEFAVFIWNISLYLAEKKDVIFIFFKGHFSSPKRSKNTLLSFYRILVWSIFTKMDKNYYSITNIFNF